MTPHHTTRHTVVEGGAPPPRRRRRYGEQLPPGTMAGDYVLEKVIAAGGFGSVYRARGPGGRRAAVKVLHAELVATDQAVARFRREIDAIRRIRHPNVVDVLEVGRLADGQPWFAMELLDGDDLATVVARRGRLPPAEALAILAPICDALAAAHRRGIVHRDVKPGNVMLVGGSRPVLVDFGVAKLLDAEIGLTGSRQVIGTPAFMAPEQAGGAIDGRADVYGVGALAFFLLTGTAPFAHESRTMLLHLHRHARRQRPSTRAPLPEALDDVVVKAMRIEPADRYDDVASLGRALAAALDLPAEPDGPAVACRVRVVPSRDGDDVADAIADALEDATARLDGAGFTRAVDAGRTQVWLRPAGADPSAVLAVAQSAARQLERRRSPAVTVRAALRVGDRAELLDLWRWDL